MSASVRRSLAAVVAACTLGLLALVFLPSTPAPGVPKPVATPVKAQNMIVIPSPDQVTSAIDASNCPPLTAGTADAHPMSAVSAQLLATPLAAAEYAMYGLNGVSSVARLYGC